MIPMTIVLNFVHLFTNAPLDSTSFLFLDNREIVMKTKIEFWKVSKMAMQVYGTKTPEAASGWISGYECLRKDNQDLKTLKKAIMCGHAGELQPQSLVTTQMVGRGKTNAT